MKPWSSCRLGGCCCSTKLEQRLKMPGARPGRHSSGPAVLGAEGAIAAGTGKAKLALLGTTSGGFKPPNVQYLVYQMPARGRQI